MNTPRSVYVHIPFCRHRCGYCNFTLIAKRDHLIDRYLDALELEMQSIPTAVPMDTIFIGGGTPTHLDAKQTTRLLAMIASKFELAEDGEYSMEANPHDIDESKTVLLAEHGVNRLSIGAQSFDTGKLKLLERDHDAARIESAVVYAAARFRSHSLDLIFSTPGESIQCWAEDLRRVITLQVPHISTYGLTIEKGTQFWNRAASGLLNELEEEPSAEMYELSMDSLTKAGYEHYEVSNFAMPGHRSRHNEAYWTGKSFYGFGAGAASFVDGLRATNHRSTTTYMKRILDGKSAVAESERLAPEDAARERLVFGLRRLQGISLATFEQETGFSVEQLSGDPVRRFIDTGLLIQDGDSLRLSRSGLLISDSLWPDLL